MSSSEHMSDADSSAHTKENKADELFSQLLRDTLSERAKHAHLSSNFQQQLAEQIALSQKNIFSRVFSLFLSLRLSPAATIATSIALFCIVCTGTFLFIRSIQVHNTTIASGSYTESAAVHDTNAIISNPERIPLQRASTGQPTYQNDNNAVSADFIEQELARAETESYISHSTKILRSLSQVPHGNDDIAAITNNARYQKGKQYFVNGYYDQAIKEWNTLCNDNRGNYIILNSIGLAYENMTDAQTALSYYNQSLEINVAQAAVRQRIDALK